MRGRTRKDWEGGSAAERQAAEGWSPVRVEATDSSLTVNLEVVGAKDGGTWRICPNSGRQVHLAPRGRAYVALGKEAATRNSAIVRINIQTNLQGQRGLEEILLHENTGCIRFSYSSVLIYVSYFLCLPDCFLCVFPTS